MAVAVAALWGNETKEIFSSAAAEQRMTRRPTETVSVPPPPPSPRPPFGEPQQLSPQGWREGYFALEFTAMYNVEVDICISECVQN